MAIKWVSKIGLPLVVGFSIITIPKASNETKRSRSFYENDEDVHIASIHSPTPSEVSSSGNVVVSSEEEVVTKLVDGYKINTSNFLETHLNSVRTSVIGQLNYAEAEYNNLKSAAQNEWNNLTSSISAVYDPQDQFLPSFIYALTTTLSASILVNKRSLPVRFFTPLVFATAGFKVFLPKTFDNTVESIKSWESKEYPELLSYQKSVRQFGVDAENSLLQANESFNQSLISTVRDIRLSLTK